MGAHLTPDQLAKARKVYLRTANYSAAARAIGANESTVRKALMRHESPKKSELHERALARMERKFRRHLERNGDRIERQLKEHVDDPLAAKQTPGMEPADQERLYREARQAFNAVVAARAALSKLRTDRLQRQKLRADVDQIRGKTPPVRHDHHVTVDTNDPKALHARLAALVAEAGEEPGAQPVPAEPGEAG